MHRKTKIWHCTCFCHAVAEVIMYRQNVLQQKVCKQKYFIAMKCVPKCNQSLQKRHSTGSYFICYRAFHYGISTHPLTLVLQLPSFQLQVWLRSNPGSMRWEMSPLPSTPLYPPTPQKKEIMLLLSIELL